MKIALTLLSLLLIVSLGCNVVLVGFHFSQSWEIQTLRSRRPAGAVGRLKRDLLIYSLGTANSPLILPRGLLLQESTPNGAETLGKQTGHEFLLGIHADSKSFEELLETDHPSDGEHIEIPYSFDANDKTWWLALPSDWQKWSH